MNEQTPEQVTEEVAPVVEETAPEFTPEVEATPEMDFSDIMPPAQEQRQQEPNYDAVIEEIVGKVLNQQKVKLQTEADPTDDDDTTYLTRAELAQERAKIKQEIQQEQMQQQNAQRLISDSYQGSQQIQGKYVQKMQVELSKQGIDFQNNPQLKMSADMLFNQLKINYAAQQGRPLMNPITGQIDPILTPQETGMLVQHHWDIFSKSYIQGYNPAATRATTAPLGAGTAGMQPASGNKAPDDFAKFMEKKAAGKVTMADAMNMLLKSGQKK